jgi:hypothetical protein
MYGRVEGLQTPGVLVESAQFSTAIIVRDHQHAQVFAVLL